MTDEWQSLTHRFAISGHEGSVTVGTDEHGRPGRLEIRMAKEGGMLRGLLDALAESVSLGLQRGVPLSAYVEWPRGRSARSARAGRPGRDLLGMRGPHSCGSGDQRRGRLALPSRLRMCSRR